MKFTLLIICLSILTNLTFGQSQNENDLVFEFYKYENQNDTLSCNKIEVLKTEIIKYNQKIITGAIEIRDSLNLKDKPCYEYEFRIEPKEYLAYFIKPDTNCIDRINIPSILYVNSTLILSRIKSSSRTIENMSETIICDYEIEKLPITR